MTEQGIRLKLGVTVPGSEGCWSFPYDDRWFLMPAAEYNHDLARCSLGLAMASYRCTEEELTGRDRDAVQYLTDAGFTGLSSAQYDVPPYQDTVATLIGRRQLPGFTLIAMTVSSGRYGLEWMSNFTMGTGRRHEGFSGAAEKALQRLRAYIAGIPGRKKLWMAGFSRGAAVSNLTMGDAWAEGLFEAIYGYTFATPCVTLDPVPVPGLYNIIGKFDAVPHTPFPDWHFGRNGRDLFTPARETDSGWAQAAAKADGIYRAVTGKPFYASPETDELLRASMDTMQALMPRQEDYVRYLQGMAVNMVRDGRMPAIRDFLGHFRVSEELPHLQQKLAEELAAMLHREKDTPAEEAEAADKTPAASGEMSHEHEPAVYLSWLFSQEDGAVYTTNSLYRRLSWTGDVNLYLFDDRGRFILGLNEAGETGEDDGLIADGPDAPMRRCPAPELPSPFVSRKGKKSQLLLPRDRAYTCAFYAERKAELDYTILDCDSASLKAVSLGRCRRELGEGDGLILVFDPESDPAEIGSPLNPDDVITDPVTVRARLTALLRSGAAALQDRVNWKQLAGWLEESLMRSNGRFRGGGEHDRES